MKFLLICTVIIVASMTEAFGNEDELTALDSNFLRDSVNRAKRLVDTAYAESRKNLKLRAKRESASYADISRYMKQPVAQCRNAIRTADYMGVTFQLIVEKLKCIYPGPFNVSDVLTAEQKEIISKLTGCAYQYLPRVCSDSPYREFNGECNNRKNPILGASYTAFKRHLLPQYENVFDTPRGWTEDLPINGHVLPPARLVSNLIVRYNESLTTDDPERSQMFMQWGQLLDHDITLSPDTPATSAIIGGVDCATSCARAYPCFPLKIPANDPRINQSDCIPLFRSAPVCNLVSPYREQMNTRTAFIDASEMYGSDKDLATKLRNTSSNLGLMAINQKYTDHGRALLPFDEVNGEICTLTNPSAGIPCFLAGDERVSEQLGLTSFQTLLLREHNRIATQLHGLNSHWSGERLYQETRKIIGSIKQKITLKDWAPLLLGSEMPHVLPPYTGYNDTEDPRVSNILTNALRVGHTLVYPLLTRLGYDYQPHETDPVIPLHKAFFSVWRIVNNGGIDPFLMGMMANSAKLNKQDQIVTQQLRDHLFESLGRIALDLPAINMQRARDHGLAAYISWRRFFGLSVPRNVDELAVVLNNAELARKLIDLYKTPENIDFWIGGVSEPLVPGGRGGKLLCSIIGDQLRRTRDGDRFYYELDSVLTKAQRHSIEETTFSQMICANTNITKVPRNVFKANEYPKDFVPCSEIKALDLNPWKEDIKSGKAN